MPSQPPIPRVRIIRASATRRLVRLGALALGIPLVATLVAVVAIRLAPGQAVRSAVPAPDAALGTPTPPDTIATAGTPFGAAPRREVRPRRVVAGGAPASPASTPGAADEPELDAATVIRALRAEGETGGIAAFGLPGTDPPKPGIIVPENFELPEGYVRHHQSTDDGVALPPILMVHPDYELVDAEGKPVAVPGRVVPPELAPPGMPIEMLEPPEAGAGDPAP